MRLSTAQLSVLNYLACVQDQVGVPPSVAEVARATGRSPTAAWQLLARLEGKGLVKHREGFVRSWGLTQDGRELLHRRTVEVPVLRQPVVDSNGE